MWETIVVVGGVTLIAVVVVVRRSGRREHDGNREGAPEVKPIAMSCSSCGLGGTFTYEFFVVSGPLLYVCGECSNTFCERCSGDGQFAACPSCGSRSCERAQNVVRRRRGLAP